jgi:hypothetical protein
VIIAQSRWGRCIEGLPTDVPNQAGPAELWTGPFSIFEQAGFQIVSDFAPYPVLSLRGRWNADLTPGGDIRRPLQLNQGRFAKRIARKYRKLGFVRSGSPML